VIQKIERPRKPRKVKEVEVVTKAKKWLTPYLLFVKAVRKRIQDENPGREFKDYMQILSQRWQNITPEEKQQYIDASNRDKVRYQEEKQYLESHPATSVVKVKRKKRQQVVEIKPKAKNLDTNAFLG